MLSKVTPNLSGVPSKDSSPIPSAASPTRRAPVRQTMSRAAKETSVHVRIRAEDKKRKDTFEQWRASTMDVKVRGAVLTFFAMILSGLLFYRFHEGMPWLHACYFVTVSICTVGFGDVTPTTDVGKVVTSLYVFAALLFIAESIGVVADYVQEKVARLSAEKARKEQETLKKSKAIEILKDIDDESRRAMELLLRLRAESEANGGKEGGAKTAAAGRAHKATLGGGGPLLAKVGLLVAAGARRGTEARRELGGQSSPVEEGRDGDGEESEGTEEARGAEGVGAGTGTPILRTRSEVEKGSPQRELKKSAVMEQERSEIQGEKSTLVLSVAYVLTSVVVGTVFFALYPGEEKTWVDAFYISCITCTTVGYGDIYPETEGGRIFAIVWVVGGTILVARSIGNYLEFAAKRKQLEIRSRLLALPLSLDEIEMADIDDNGSLSQAEFVLFKLQAMGILAPKDVSLVELKFQEELSPGPDGEVQIPDPARVDQVLKEGGDFKLAVKCFQEDIAKKEREASEDKRRAVATSSIVLQKLGVFNGAVYKLRRLIDTNGSEELKRLMRADKFLADLPPVETSEEEIALELQAMDYESAEAKLARNATAKSAPHARRGSVVIDAKGGGGLKLGRRGSAVAVDRALDQAFVTSQRASFTAPTFSANGCVEGKTVDGSGASVTTSGAGKFRDMMKSKLANKVGESQRILTDL